MAKAWANKADDHNKAWGKMSEKQSLSEPPTPALDFGNKKTACSREQW
ncbi:MAG: hypothetical protein K6B74_05870 [Ruminococcus sp.]|nr:hypothetical protein [Ruminococcus sp.]